MIKPLILLVMMTVTLCMTAQMARQNGGFKREHTCQDVQNHAPVTKKYGKIWDAFKQSTPSVSPRGNDWWEPDTIVMEMDNEHTQRDILSYNTHGLVTLRLKQSQDGQAWEDIFRITYNYDENNHLSLEVGQEWENDAWVNFCQAIYGYEGNNLTNDLSQLWDGTNWINNYQGIYTYYEDNNLKAEMFQVWEDEDDTWINDMLYTYTYSDNKPITQLEQIWDEDEWVNDYLGTGTYDGENLIQILFQFWEDQWINDERISISYNENNMMKQLMNAIWEYNTWLDYLVTDFTYDENNNLTEKEESYLEYQVGWKTTWHYDDNNNTDRVENWMREGSTWELYETDCPFYYNNMQSEMEIEAQVATITYTNINAPNAIADLSNETTVCVFPNPTKGQLTINNEQLTIEQVEVFDVLGRCVLTVTPSPLDRAGVRLDISDIPTGMYFVRITTEKETVTKKIVLSKE